MKEIKLTQGKVALVDDHWFDELNKYKWYYKGGYAVRNVNIDGKRHHIHMHRVVNNTPENKFTDHINHNGCDNQESNLRDASHQENMINKPKQSNNSGFKGVYFDKKSNKFKTQISFNNKYIYLGYFNTAEEAYTAYCKAAKKYHGEFSNVD